MPKNIIMNPQPVNFLQFFGQKLLWISDFTPSQKYKSTCGSCHSYHSWFRRNNAKSQVLKPPANRLEMPKLSMKWFQIYLEYFYNGLLERLKLESNWSGRQYSRWKLPISSLHVLVCFGCKPTKQHQNNKIKAPKSWPTIEIHELPETSRGPKRTCSEPIFSWGSRRSII